MTQALYYKPSYERLQAQILQAAPALDIVLIDDAGNLTHEGRVVTAADISPEYFWIHSELFKSPLFRDYLGMIGNFPSARWLHTINTGLDKGPYLDLLRQGLTITNNHSQAIAIAEYVMARVLAHFQDLPAYTAMQAQGAWQYRPFRELSGSRWLLVGFGHIGREIAVRAKPFGVHLTAVRRGADGEGLADAVCTLDGMGEALARADVVVLACASNAQTRGLVDAAFLGAMQENSVLVNVARGDLVVEDDLKAALDAGRPAYAILDVFNEEPLPADAWFWRHPRVCVTPHCSNAGSGMRRRSDALFIDNLARMAEGREPRNLVTEKDIL